MTKTERKISIAKMVDRLTTIPERNAYFCNASKYFHCLTSRMPQKKGRIKRSINNQGCSLVIFRMLPYK